MRKCFGDGTAASCCGRQLWSDAKVVVPIPISTVRIDWPRRDDLQCRQGKRGGTRCQRYGQFEPHAATPPEPAFRDSFQCEISERASRTPLQAVREENRDSRADSCSAPLRGSANRRSRSGSVSTACPESEALRACGDFGTSHLHQARGYQMSCDTRHTTVPP